MIFAILGALGRQGPAILRYLMDSTDSNVITVDHPSVPVPEDFGGKWLDRSRWTHTVAPHEAWSMIEGRKATVISCLDPSRNLELALRCLRKRWNYVDLGGDTAVSRGIANLDGTAREKGVVLASECGIAPGLISSIAASCEREGASSVRIFCGGIPQRPRLPFGYALSFSATGLVREYSGTAEYRRNGKMESVPSLTERELIHVPQIGVLEAFSTSGGLGTAPESLGLECLEYKTLRYPGHLSMLKCDIMWRHDAGGIIERICPAVSPDNPDLIVLLVETRKKGSTDTELSSYFWRFDFEAGFSAMAQATGYSVAALASLVADGEFPDGGFLAMHDVPWDSWLDRILRMPGQMLPARSVPIPEC